MDDQLDNIKELLFPDYWKAEAQAIIEYAAKHGFTADDIAYALTRFGVEPLLTTAYIREIDARRFWGLVGPQYDAPYPFISFGTVGFSPI